jgi:predicted metal-dependent peptidase
MNANDRLIKAHIDIMRDPVFASFCAVISCGESAVRDDVSTACTDGWNKYYGKAFVDKLTQPELRFVVLHENFHVALQHLHMWKHLWSRDPQGANIAADMMVNLAIMQADNGRGFVHMPAIGVQPDPQYTDMSVQQVYDAMKRNPPPQGKGGQDGMDSHDWENAPAPGTQEAEERGEAIAQAVRQGEIVRQRSNRGTGSADGVFGDLLAPRVDWKQALREFIRDLCLGRDDSTWRRPNRRYLSDDMLMPSMHSERVGEVVVGFDTSGSCFGSAEMTRFATEVRALIEETCPSTCHVIYWGTEVVGHQQFVDGQFSVANLKPKGGGGTDGSVLFDYLREKKINPVAIVQLTDGEVGDWGRSDWPTLWAMTTKIRAPYGRTIHL